MDTIKDLEPDRKCWRMVGGVMVERTIKEVVPALRTKLDSDVSLSKFQYQIFLQKLTKFLYNKKDRR